MHQPGEPSVEEILESIKLVIARDNREGAIAERRRRAQDGVSPDQSPKPADEPAEKDEMEEVLELDEQAMLAAAAQDHAMSEDDGEADADENPPTVDSPLTGTAKLEAMRQNFAALEMISRPGKPPQIVRSGETSLEGLVRDLLRPMLAEWLDENLPGMVEEMVKAEISRIAGKRS